MSKSTNGAGQDQSPMLDGSVSFFDHNRGVGLFTLEGEAESAEISARILRDHGYSRMLERHTDLTGFVVSCRVGTGPRGLSVEKLGKFERPRKRA